MLNLPPAIMTVLVPFAPLFHAKTWRKVPVLLIGTILTPGKRTVTAALRVMGLKDDSKFAKYHQVLNRAAWSPLAVAKRLLDLLVTMIYPDDTPSLNETPGERLHRYLHTNNLARPHESLREPIPGLKGKYRYRRSAMVLGLTDRVLTVGDILRTPRIPTAV
jgi:hypothetical protein